MYWLLRGFAFVISLLGERQLDLLARFFAFLIFRVFRIRRRIMRKNLEIAFGSEKTFEERERIAAHSVYNMVLSGLEVFHNFEGTLWRGVVFQNEDYLRDAVRDHGGAYLLVTHTGNIDALAAGTVRFICKGYTAVKKVGSNGVNRFVEELRRNYGLQTNAHRQKGEGFREIKDHVTTGGAAAFFLDQTRPGGSYIPFFGTPAKTSTSLAGIWRKVPAPIIPAMSRRLGVNRHTAEFFPAVEMVATDDAQADLIENTRRCLQALEMMIRRNPEQWLWMHNRWK